MFTAVALFVRRLVLAPIDRAGNASSIFEHIRPDVPDLCGLQIRKLMLVQQVCCQVLKTAKPRRALFIHQCTCCQRSAIQTTAVLLSSTRPDRCRLGAGSSIFSLPWFSSLCYSVISPLSSVWFSFWTLPDLSASCL